MFSLTALLSVKYDAFVTEVHQMTPHRQ